MHRPVLLDEAIEGLAVKAGGTYIDATVGSGGHAARILAQAGPSGRLLGIDRDPEALRRSAGRLAGAAGEVVLVHGNHADLQRLAEAHGFSRADGILLDLGVSSDQLDTAARGFSFSREGPLDMRMDPTRGETAADLLARLDVADLARLLRECGEVPGAGRVARAIDRARRESPILTTGRLADVISRAMGGRRGRLHPATLAFMALRVATNGEIEALEAALDGAFRLLAADGRLATISFESVSDRVVKHAMAAHVGVRTSLPQGGWGWRRQAPAAAWVVRRPIRPTAAETAANPRAASAKLRVVRRLRPEEEAAEARA